jgi:hypothetical protein
MIQLRKEIDVLITKKAEQLGYTKADYIVWLLERTMRGKK